MKKQFLETGKIVGTHGIKGMVRIDYWSDSAGFVSAFKRFFLDEKGERALDVVSAAPHGNVVIAKFKGVDSIADAETLRGKTIYIDRDDVSLPEGRYFVEDLIGCEVHHLNGEALGVLADVSKTGANDVWHIKSGDKEYLVPAIDEVIISVDIDAKKIILNPMKGIFDDAN